MSLHDGLEAPAIPRPSPFWTLVETAMTLAFVGMLAVMLIQVVSRYALAVGVPWTDETSRYLFVAQIFLGFAVAERYGMNIRVTLVLDVLPDRARQVLELIGYLLTVLVAAALLVGSARMISQTSNVPASTLPITMAWLYAVQAFGLVLYVVLIARDILSRAKAVFSGRSAA